MRFSNKKLFGVATIALSTLAAVGVVGASNGAFAGILATSTATGKHYAAVMPTATTQGIREYWTDCVGGNPVFTEPAYPVTDANLTAAQVQAILADPADERIIPTLDRIQAAVTKGVDGTNAYDVTFVKDAFAYTYLDTTTKTQITGANVEAIENAYLNFDKYFIVVYDAGKDLIPITEQQGVSITRGYDADYGDVLLVSTELGSAGGSSQLYFYGINRNAVTYGVNDSLNFAVYSPFAAVGNTSQTYWCGSYGTATKITGNPQAWTRVASTGTALNSDGSIATTLGAAVSLQRYVNGTIDPYTGTYKVTSIVAEKELTEEGMVVLRGKNAIADVHSWGAEASTVDITYGVLTEYGTATKVDIKAKTSVLELEWTGLDVSKLKNYKYVRMFVYARTTQRVFVALEQWRNKTASIWGVNATAEDVTAQANAVQSIANVVADQWNIIDIPTSNLKQDTDGKIYVAVWADKNEAKDGWYFTDLIGHNQNVVVENGGLLAAYNSCTVAPTYNEDAGICTRVTLTATRGYAKQNAITNISEFESISFMVKNESTASMKILLYKLNDSTYGDAVKGKNQFYTLTVAAGEWAVGKVNLSEYFGDYAATSKIMFAVDGAVGNSMLIGNIEAK